jgi:chemosensory pili system protein ChpA (sensor histidine kinase/response regulator)
VVTSAGDRRVGTDIGFEDAEARTLRGFFRDEAHEYLETITHGLLRAGAAVPAVLMDEFMRTTHTLKGSAATVGLRGIAEAGHDLEECFVRLRAGTISWNSAVADKLVAAIDSLRAAVDAVDDPVQSDLLVAATRAQLSGLIATAAEPVEPSEPVGALDTDIRDRAQAEAPGSSAEVAFAAERRRDEPQVLRVEADRVERLMNGVGQLVFASARIERRGAELRRLVRELTDVREHLRHQMVVMRGVTTPDAFANVCQQIGAIEATLGQGVARLARSTSGLVDDTESLRQMTRELRSAVTEVRMASVGRLFARLARSVREIARQAGKRVEITCTGGETEFDKAVADQIADPLLQLLRNAVAHGIEDEEARRAVGKPPAGQVRLSARQEGNTILLEVSDDGSGIDVTGLRERLVAQRIWSRARAERANEAALLRAMFEPGVSTRDETDTLAGRGFGLDAVRETLARLGGAIRVESVQGCGTTFVLRLPLTAALSEVLLFRVGGQVYAAAAAHVAGTREMDRPNAADGDLPDSLLHQGEQIPLLSMHRVVQAPLPARRRRISVVLIEYSGRQVAITCDRVIGVREVVIKALGPLLSNVALFAGGTIGSSGNVQLVLNPAALASLAYGKEAAEAACSNAAHDAGPAAARRILFADDSQSVRETLSRVMTGAGYIVDTAADGARALTMLREVSYDLLVTDIEMPELDGLALLKAVRADGELRHIPCIVISSRAARGVRDRALALGAANFLGKPVTQRKLLTIVGRILGNDGD